MKRTTPPSPKVVPRGLPIVLSSPSGAGKTTVSKLLLQQEPNLVRSVSCTTRAKRKGEREGRDYFFMTPGEFWKIRRADGFLEWAEVYTHYYGTPRAWVEAQLAKGRDVLFVIDVQGARSLRRRLPEAVHLFLLPPDWATLEARLKGRGSESPETLRVRLKTARKELREAACYDHQVVNDRVAWAVGRIRRILRLERRKRQKTLKKA
jgi:guanylate kinase